VANQTVKTDHLIVEDGLEASGKLWELSLTPNARSITLPENVGVMDGMGTGYTLLCLCW